MKSNSSISCIFVLMLVMPVSGEHRRVQEDIDECVVFSCCDVDYCGEGSTTWLESDQVLGGYCKPSVGSPGWIPGTGNPERRIDRHNREPVHVRL
jgi:hypothetical protein